MKPNSIVITYKIRKYTLNRVENKNYHIGFETDRWSIRFYLLQDNEIRIIINKLIKKSDTDYHTQFCYDCYCTRLTDILFLNHVSNPATCKRIRNCTKWFTIEPMLREIYSQLKEEINALHHFDRIHDFGDVVQFIYRKLKSNDGTEYTVNNSLRFGIGENACIATEEAMQAKEIEPIALLNLYNGFHTISIDAIVFFLYWLRDRDGKLFLSDGERIKNIDK